MVLPQLADPLAGRMEIHTLWPFSQGEFGRARDTFIDALFAKRFAPGEIAGETWRKLTDRLSSPTSCRFCGAMCGILLAEAARERFVRGIVLYTGMTTVSFGKNLTAVPVPALWSAM